MYEIGIINFFFGFNGYNDYGVSLLDPTYFNVTAYRVNFYSTAQWMNATKTDYIELPLSYLGNQLREAVSDPVFQNLNLENFYCANSTNYTVGGNWYKY